MFPTPATPPAAPAAPRFHRKSFTAVTKELHAHEDRLNAAILAAQTEQLSAATALQDFQRAEGAADLEMNSVIAAIKAVRGTGIGPDQIAVAELKTQSAEVIIKSAAHEAAELRLAQATEALEKAEKEYEDFFQEVEEDYPPASAAPAAAVGAAVPPPPPPPPLHVPATTGLRGFINGVFNTKF